MSEAIRVYELAKELNLANKDIIETLENKMGVKVKSHSSVISGDQATKLKEILQEPKVEFTKKPKAFIVKKAKPAPLPEVEPETEVQSNAEAQTETDSPKEEGKPVIPQQKVIEKVNLGPVNPPPVRHTLQNNSHPSAQRNGRQDRDSRPYRPEQRPAPRTDQRPDQRPGQRPPFGQRTDRPNQPYNNQRPAGAPGQPPRPFNRDARPVQGGPPFNRPARPAGEAGRPAPAGDRKPIQRHIIPQEIYDSKNPSKKKVVGKKKERTFKSKEEEQERISLEKASAQKHRKRSHAEEIDEAITKVVINQPVTVSELSDKINRASAEIVRFLMMEGILATVNQVIDVATAKKVCENFEIEVTEEDVEAFMEEELKKEEKAKAFSEIDQKLLKRRAPVVTIMGHVDHGKTTLLDSIRASKHKIVSTEVGGITQSIGAYTVHLNKKKIVFIDTPGHEAFTEMRARGAKSTDIAILVVAADDGIMPQTIEAINHAKAAEVPIIVAVNKIDKPGADADRIMQQLTEYGLVSEAWGGDTICQKVSALLGTGIDELLEYIVLVAEMQDLKANPDALATGVVIEANLDKGKGPVATLLVQNGTLKTGDCVVVGNVSGRVRALLSDSGERVKKAGPSTPVEILGLTEVPQAGDAFQSMESDKAMKVLVQERKIKDRTSRLESMIPAYVRNDIVGEKEDEVQQLNLIIKASTNGSAEALSQSINQFKSKEIVIKMVHIGVGDISEADVMLAAASNAIILGFTVKEDLNAMNAAAKEKVTIKKYDIIYQILEDLEKTMLNLLQPEIKEVELGRAEVRQVFTVGKTGKIAGCYVLEGKILKGKTAIVLRNSKEIFKGQIDQLKRFKDDVKEVATGFECGISFAKFNDLEEGDIIEVSTTESVERQVLV